MTIEVFLCPQYSGNLEEVHKSGYYTCPYCRTRMRINVYEPDPNTQPDGRRTILTGIRVPSSAISNFRAGGSRKDRWAGSR